MAESILELQEGGGGVARYEDEGVHALGREPGLNMGEFLYKRSGDGCRTTVGPPSKVHCQDVHSIVLKVGPDGADVV